MAWETLTRVASDRFHAHLASLPGGAPRHGVEFSRRITNAWALIYYRRHLVRLSPYLFLLDADELRHPTHWQELDATLRHEAAHACLYARARETRHTPEFHDLLARLGVVANGRCDLGPENAAFRYEYGCPACGATWRRRVPILGNVSCGACSDRGYDARFRLSLLADLGSPWVRLRSRTDLVQQAVEEALAASPVPPVGVVARRPAPSEAVGA